MWGEKDEDGGLLEVEFPDSPAAVPGPSVMSMGTCLASFLRGFAMVGLYSVHIMLWGLKCYGRHIYPMLAISTHPKRYLALPRRSHLR